MSEGEAQAMEFLRSLIERLTSSELTLGEAKLLRLQLAPAMEQATWPGNDSRIPGVIRVPST